MKKVSYKAAAASAPVGYVRRSPAMADTHLSVEARALLRSIDPEALPIHLACAFPRIVNRIALLWRSPEVLGAYFDDLLIDKRGDRQGFPAQVVADLMALKSYYETQVFRKPKSVWDEAHSVRGAWPKLNAKG